MKSWGFWVCFTRRFGNVGPRTNESLWSKKLRVSQLPLTCYATVTEWFLVLTGIYLLFNSKTNILFVLVRHSRQIYKSTRQVDSLLASKGSSILNNTLQEIITWKWNQLFTQTKITQRRLPFKMVLYNWFLCYKSRSVIFEKLAKPNLLNFDRTKTDCLKWVPLTLLFHNQWDQTIVNEDFAL